MNHLDYFITFDECKDKTLREFMAILKNLPKKCVGTVQLSELCSTTEYPNGIYFLFAPDGELCYVGKATSRSFIERIPAHFDQRDYAWFNTLPKKIMKFSQIGEYADAHAIGLSFQLVLFGIKNEVTAYKLESVLRSFLKPKLNTAKKAKAI